MSLYTHDFKEVVTRLYSAVAVDYDYRGQKIFWSDVGSEKIFWFVGHISYNIISGVCRFSLSSYCQTCQIFPEVLFNMLHFGG